MDDSGKRNAAPSGKDGDGVRITAHGNRGARSALLYQVLALVLVGAFAGYLVTMASHRARSEAGNMRSDGQVSGVPADNESGNTSSQSTRLPDQQPTARPAQASRDPNDLSNYVAPGQAPAMKEVIDRLHNAGIHSGLGAFPPPGTSPPLIGLAVPDDYVLPKGYVRHSQATDDGQRIEPILMYSPDFEFFDNSGRRINIPKDRVVPPDRAPPGLAIRRIQIPPPLEPGSPPV